MNLLFKMLRIDTSKPTWKNVYKCFYCDKHVTEPNRKFKILRYFKSEFEFQIEFDNGVDLIENIYFEYIGEKHYYHHKCHKMITQQVLSNNQQRIGKLPCAR
jgi:hypothetical protein